ncbi:MAG TPA: T9SS type A sorting domain-containing protein [Bacteroidota bacterium]|jgi:ABC-type transporter MlaC component|nr:T9SS type A sorting domain-containing protein [Bacteroidota bacterium]
MKRLFYIVLAIVCLSSILVAGNKTFTGPGNFSDASKWNGNALPVAGDNLKINNGCTYDAATNLIYGNLNLGNPTPGQLTFNSGTTLTVAGISSAILGSSSLTMPNGGTLVISGATGWMVGSGFSAGTGTVSLQNTITLPTDVATYNNLTIAAGATSVTLGTATTVNGNLIISSGTLSTSASNFALNVKGNWTNSGTFTPGTGTVTFNGSSGQSLTGATAFNNLTLNNSAGLTLNNNATVNAALTLTSGAITTGANTVVIPASGSVSRTNGYVNGKLQKNVATGATSRTFEVGDASNYTPVNVSFASVTTAGNLTAQTTAGDHPNLGTSSIDASKSVNRYWTLTNSGVVFTNYSATFNFAGTDVDGGANTANFLVNKYNSPNWSLPATGTTTSTSTQATGLTSFSDFAVGEPFTYSVTATAGANGSISPSGTVSVLPGANQAFTITPNAGYHVLDVLVDGVSVGAVSADTLFNVTAAHTIDASFAINTYTITSSAGANGSISPLGAVGVNYGSDTSFTITANAGYHVADVLVDGVSIGAVTSHTFSSVTGNHTIDASFALTTYTITASAGANGSISPSGGIVVNEGVDTTFTVTANAGYHIADVLVDGVSIGAAASHTFSNVTANHTIDASFAIDVYTITATAGANGSISPSGAVSVNHGSDTSFTITANVGYHVADVLVDGVSIGAVGSHTFPNVTANHTIDASFVINDYTITATAGANGSISPSGVVGVTHGSDTTFTITANTGYHVADVLVDGVSIGAVTSRTFTNVTANHTIDASFAINVYTITASAGANGSISPNGAVSVNHGSDTTFTITAGSGYHVADVLVDGVSIGAVTSHTFTNVTGNHTIDASFAITVHTIAATAGAHGSISPSGTVFLNDGDSQKFTITPAAGYFIADVQADSVSVGQVSTYTFNNVTADHTIEATFGIQTFKVTSLAAGGGSISPSGSTVVNYGDTASYTITAGTGYYISDVHVDSVSVGAVSNYSFANVTQNHLIEAFFAIQTFKVTSSAGAGGTITPLGSTVVNYGDSVTYTIAANSGYYISDVHVDSASVGPLANYTLHNVHANHFITAFFAAVNTPPTAATLIAPLNGDTVYLDIVGVSLDFLWHSSVDADSVTYTLHLHGTSLDTLLTGLVDTTKSWGIVNLLQPGQTYQWTVIASDGHVSVASPDTFSFYATMVVGVKDLTPKIPKVYALHQNYPNPFNPTTVVQFDLPRASTVTLTVYNILGQQVATLANKQSMDAGYKSFTFDASTIPSGAYFYRIYAQEANGNAYVSVKKMVLMK